MSLKDNRKGYVGGFRVRKGKGEIFYRQKNVLGRNIFKNVSQYM